MTFYVLHNFLDEIGLVAWMRAQNGFIFKEAHRHGGGTPAALVLQR
jgi:hypothetical protein